MTGLLLVILSEAAPQLCGGVEGPIELATTLRAPANPAL